jgi:hypothetical protein
MLWWVAPSPKSESPELEPQSFTLVAGYATDCLIWSQGSSGQKHGKGIHKGNLAF